MTVVYDPLTYRTLVSRPGEVPYKFWSVNKLVIDAAAAGLCTLHSGDDAPGDTTKLWLDLTMPENAVGSVKAYDGASWVALTPQLFYSHIAGGATGFVTDAEMTAYVSSLIGSTLQPYDADLTTWAGLTPSENAQSLVTAANYAAMKALLDLEIGIDVQAYDADLTTWAGLTPSANAQSLVTAANYSAMRTLLGLVIGTDVQAYDAELAAFAGLTSAANKIGYFTGVGTMSTTDFTAAGISMVGAASAAAQTALLSVMVGDSGSGGAKGLVPAQVAGDAAKFLRGDGTFQSIPGGGDALTSGTLAQFASTTSAQLRGVLSDETGTGVAVFGTSPSITTSMLLDSGFVFNWNAGDLTLTHSSNLLTLAGGNFSIGTSGVFTAGTVEVGHASNNTIASSAAGTIDVKGSRVYQRNNIVGTVSQSGGIPTGNILEYGTNANGEYIRYADGTQICWFNGVTCQTATAAGSVFTSAASSTWTFPAAFSVAPSISALTETVTRWAAANTPSTTAVAVRQFAATSSATDRITLMMAIGRWY